MFDRRSREGGIFMLKWCWRSNTDLSIQAILLVSRTSSHAQWIKSRNAAWNAAIIIISIIMWVYIRKIWRNRSASFKYRWHLFDDIWTILHVHGKILNYCMKHKPLRNLFCQEACLYIFIIYKLFTIQLTKKKTFFIKEKYPSCDLEMNKLRFILFFNRQFIVDLIKYTHAQIY